MKTRLFAIAVTVFALSLGVALTITAQGTTQHWAQVNPNGFGDSANGTIGALAPFNGQLYAGTFNNNGAQVWRRVGASWSPVITNGFGITRNGGVDHLYPFNGQLYASTYNEIDGGEVWRSGNGLDWTRVVTQGFGDPTNGEVMRFAVFTNTLYASTWSYTTTHGAEVWRSGTGNAGDWSRVVTNGFDGNTNNGSVLSFGTFNGYLYAGTRNSTTGSEVWRSPTGNTGSWTHVNTDGFGDTGNLGVSALSSLGDYLYAATFHSTAGGAQVWRCQTCDGSDWTKVVDNGFGNINTRRLPALEVFDNYLYFTIGNNVTGLEVWRTANGTHWEQVGFNGFGDVHNNATYWDNAVTAFNNGLYVGTSNYADGGEIWVYKPQIATLYVAPGGNCGGATPCYATIQSAVDAASDLDVIKVATGAYTDLHVRGRNDVTTTGVVTQVVYVSVTLSIEGGYTTTNWTTPDPEANPTTLNAQGKGRVFYIIGGIDPTIEGLRITGGDASGLLGDPHFRGVDVGGGVYIYRADPTLALNRIYNNSADEGGGLWLNNASATLISNTITGNTASAGGGLNIWFSSDVTLTGNTFVSNTANDGGGLFLFVCRAMLDGNTITANRANRGGGVFMMNRADATFKNTVVADNQVTGKGSGLYIEGSFPRLLHTTIARNSGGNGSGIHVTQWEWEFLYSSVAMTNTILTSHTVGVSVTGGNTVTINGVLWYNTPITVSKEVTAVVAVNSQFTGNPAFATDGCHLSLNSAAIDKGVNAGVTDDIDGESRPRGLGYDLGADELWPKMVYLPLVLR